MLTHEQLVLAGTSLVVALAFEEPGAISDIEHGASAIGHHGEKFIHGHIIQLHVKTPAGEEFYHLPISSLIIKHPPHLKGEGAKASKLVQAGQHTLAVPHDAKVMVPKDTDLTSANEIKNAAKHIVLHSAHGEERHAHISSATGNVYGDTGALSKQETQHVHDELHSNWKELPHGKQPVSFGGKVAAWAPHEWSIYKAKNAGENESKLSGKWGKDAEGHWHQINKSGAIDPHPPSGVPHPYDADLNKSEASGGVLPEHELPKVEDHHTEPVAPGAHKIDIGGVPSSKDEIHHALQLLHANKSTQVKQPLKAAGHPLQHMDYHGVSTAEIAKYPELKVSKGSKQEHVGQVKLAVMHHLSRMLGEFPQTEAETEIADHGQEEAKELAAHAQKLTPAAHDIGGVKASKDEIEQAIAHLGATKSTAIKQILSGKKNPLANSDYWAVVKAHQAQFPNSTKGMKAKETYVAALQHHLGQLTQHDQSSGHDLAAETHELVDKGQPKAKSPFVTAAGDALKLAHATGQPHYLAKQDGKWSSTPLKPADESADALYKVGPDHSVAYMSPGGGLQHWDDQKVNDLAKAAFKPGTAVKPKALTTKELLSQHTPEAELEPGEKKLSVEDWKAHPQWQELHDTVGGSKTVTYKGPQEQSKEPILTALQISSATGDPWYVIKQGNQWKLSSGAGDMGSYAAPGDYFFEATPEHQLTSWDPKGKANPWDMSGLLQYAQANLTPKEAEPEVKPPEPEAEPAAEAAEEGAKQPLLIGGKEALQVPAGTKVFHSDTQNGDAATVKYVWTPDGKWHYTQHNAQDGSYKLAPEPVEGSYANYALNGTLVEEKPEVHNLAEAPETQAETVPEGHKAVIVGGKQVTTVPDDHKIYYDLMNNGPTTSDSAQVKWVVNPEGKWQAYASHGKTYPSVHQLDKQLASGELQEEGKETPEQLTSLQHSQKLYADLLHGSVPAPAYTSEDVKTDSQYGISKALLEHVQGGSNAILAYQETPKSEWKTTYYDSSIPSSALQKGYYKTSFTNGVPQVLKITQGEGGASSVKLSQQEIQDAVGKHVTPDSIYMQELGKQFKTGFYYKPKGKAYIQVNASPEGWYTYSQAYKYGDSAKAKFLWHATDGSVKEISPAAAAKHLQTADEYHAVAKDVHVEPPKIKSLSYATVAKQGKTYGMFSEMDKAPSKDTNWEIKPDGSNLLTGPSGQTPLTEGSEDIVLKGGVLLDPHGNSVVKPGIVPEKYHLFGVPVSPEAMQALSDEMNKTYGAPGGENLKQWLKIIGDYVPGATKSGTTPYSLLKSYLLDKEANTGNKQRDAVHGLVREMLLVPHTKEGELSEHGEEQASYLKALPPGINSSKDVFHWTDQGYAQPLGPAVTDLMPGNAIKPWSSYTSPELADKIKSISTEHGDGKVVGTHVSSLSKEDRQQWLEAWRKGDMQKVFALDAKSGKVSPAHPGAPENTGTHQISWSPWNASEIPAGKPVPGEWSDYQKVTLPKAEINNYVIKAGLQNAEQLSDQQKRQWVVSHRDGNQEIVDHLSRTAAQRSAAGYAPQSEPPSFTDDLQPAKSYDTYVEDKNPATSWSAQALKDYIGDHWEDHGLAEHDSSGEGKQYNLDSSYASRQTIQHYLDAQHQKYVEEQSKPVWSLTPGQWNIASTNPIMPVTRTIPLTGEQAQWFFKPAPKPFRAEVEHMAGQLGNLWGFKTPKSELMDFNGHYGQAQQKLDNVGDMTFGQQLGFYDRPSIDWSQMTQRQVSDIGREHLLDWALANDDDRASNLLRTPEGGIVGIDKGRAYRNLGFHQHGGDSYAKGDWQGLDGGKGADSNAALISTQMFDAMRDHSIGKDVADKAFIDTMQRAQKMQRLPDDRMREVLLDGIKNRPGLSSDADRQAFAQLAIDRKNGLADDMQHLWGKVYKDAGWTLPEVPESKLPEGAGGARLYSGFSDPEFTDAVKASKSYGTPAFFGGTDLQNGNFLVWHEYAGSGKDSPQITGQGEVRGDGYKKMTDWAKLHQDEASKSNYHYTEPEPKDPSDVPVAKGYYSHIISAAKTVSHHVTDKEFNQAKLTQMEDTKQALEGHLKMAENTLQAGYGSTPWKNYEQLGVGHPAAVQDMAKHYLAQIHQVEEGKDNGTKFKAGDLPEWEPSPQLKEAVQPPPEPGQPPPAPTATVKPLVAELKPYERFLASGHNQTKTLDDNGELHTSSHSSKAVQGLAWHVQLPTGERIVLHGGSETGTPLAQQGRVTFHLAPGGGSESLARVHDTLQEMGMHLPEAEDHDLRLFYWRHLANVLAERSDRDTGKRAKVLDEMRTQAGQRGIELGVGSTSSTSIHNDVQKIADAKLDPQDELNLWHSAWSHLTSADQVQHWEDSGGTMPHMEHFDLHNPAQPNGKPFWMRFDIDPHDLASRPMPSIASSNADTNAERMVNGGGKFSSDGRLRVLGMNPSGVGMGSQEKDAAGGAAGVVYTRLNQETKNNAVLSPAVLARTTTYGFNDDHYGNISYRKNESPWDLDSLMANYSSNNETNIRDGVSFLDSIEQIEAPDYKRTQLIQHLHDLGIHEIRGVPVEQRIVPEITHSSLTPIKSALASDTKNLGWHE